MDRIHKTTHSQGKAMYHSHGNLRGAFRVAYPFRMESNHRHTDDGSKNSQFVDEGKHRCIWPNYGRGQKAEWQWQSRTDSDFLFRFELLDIPNWCQWWILAIFDVVISTLWSPSTHSRDFCWWNHIHYILYVWCTLESVSLERPKTRKSFLWTLYGSLADPSL